MRALSYVCAFGLSALLGACIAFELDSFRLGMAAAIVGWLMTIWVDALAERMA